MCIRDSLVSDDVVEIRKVSDDTLIGNAPDITKHFIELRGIGIIDVKTLFGVSSVKDTQSIDVYKRQRLCQAEQRILKKKKEMMIHPTARAAR